MKSQMEYDWEEDARESLGEWFTIAFDDNYFPLPISKRTEKDDGPDDADFQFRILGIAVENLESGEGCFLPMVEIEPGNQTVERDVFGDAYFDVEEHLLKLKREDHRHAKSLRLHAERKKEA